MITDKRSRRPTRVTCRRRGAELSPFTSYLFHKSSWFTTLSTLQCLLLMSSTLTSLAVLSVLVSPALAAPTVSLLIDNGYASSGTLNIKTVLQNVSTRKGSTFHFGSTYDTYAPNQSWAAGVFNTFFNHIVAENGCKWDATEPSRGTSSLSGCQGVQSFGATYGDSFRGHNTFWHSQTPVSLSYCAFLRIDLTEINALQHSHGFQVASQRVISLPTLFLNTSSRKYLASGRPSPLGMSSMRSSATASRVV